MRIGMCVIGCICVVALAGCDSGGKYHALTGDLDGRDCEAYAIHPNWLVYAWSPPVATSRPIHLVVRDLTSGVETELEPNWWAPGPLIEEGKLVYAKPAGGSGMMDIIVYDLQGKTSSVIKAGKVSDLAFSGNTLAWRTWRADNSQVIAIASVRGGAIELIEDAGRPEFAADTSPRLSGNQLVFMRQDLSSREYSLMLHNMSAGTTEALPIASPSGFDFSDGKLVYTKQDDDSIYLMDLGSREEKAIAQAPRRLEGPIMRKSVVAWTTHMAAEDFKGIAGQPLVDHRDFRSVHATDIISGNSATFVRDQFMVRSVRISPGGVLYGLVPRGIATGPEAIADVVSF